MIVWDKRYSVGVEKLDQQHQMFFSLINKLEDLTTHDTFLDELPRLLNEIVEYATLHFKSEEDLLARINYADLAGHHEHHENIKKDIYMECKRIIEREPTSMDVMWLYNYMNNWIKHHILEVDMMYVEAFKDE